ncbi:hypothetical protein [Salipaludibacillus daqingensis]|uniref:hypothetical protein n=1 Tax=Salipaludibacillus daqingensis TaxID=3041001 RepID=UPI002473A043|nr:hypothetical protein [Salipaludibacillus daqingensis]
MQNYISVIIPLFILYFTGVIDWFRLKRKKGVFYNNSWERSLLTMIGFAIILYGIV